MGVAWHFSNADTIPWMWLLSHNHYIMKGNFIPISLTRVKKLVLETQPTSSPMGQITVTTAQPHSLFQWWNWGEDLFWNTDMAHFRNNQ